jgi:anaerobic selenocysteine-containing dehydrogenase
MNRDPTSRVVKTVCAHDCPDACSVLISVEDGRCTRFRGDPEHPFTRGFLCGKVNNYEEVVHSPDRVLHPLRRIGPKGRGEFARISWDEAIGAIAGRIREVRERDGGEALLQYYYAGTMGYVHRYSGEALFNKLGATRLRQNICYYGADEGYRVVLGLGYGLDPEDVVHSDLIVVWGCNVASTQVHLVPFFDQARARGARLIVIDPYRNRTAAMADEHWKVRPGTDAALALAMAHVIERDGLADRRFLAERTIGYERLRDEVLPRYTPERAAAIAGIDAGAIEDLARRLAGARAPCIKVGIGLGRNSNGAAGVRAICCLAGVVGAYEKLGGGVLYDSGCEFKVKLDAVTRPDWRERPARTVNMTQLGEALNDWTAPPIRFLYVHGSNPAATAPEQERVKRGLAREDLFTVVHERFLTDTARWADLVLPAPSFAEVDDLYKSYGHLYLQRGRAAIAPLGECRPNLEVFQAIGKALGFDDAWFSRSVEDFIRELLATEHPNFRGIDPERVLAGATVRLSIPRGESGFKERFKTPSGKLEFYSRELEEAGGPALPGWRGDVFGGDADRHPYRLITPPAHHFLNASFGASPRQVRRAGGEPRVLVHAADAAREGIADGDRVELFNDLGSARLLARVSDESQPGVLIAEGTWWPLHGRGSQGINALTSSRLTDLGEGSTFHDNRVGIKRLEAGDWRLEEEG